MPGKSFYQRLQTLQEQRIQVETKGYHVGYLIHKGVLVYVGIDFIEVDCGNKGIVIPISEIRTITLR